MKQQLERLAEEILLKKFADAFGDDDWNIEDFFPEIEKRAIIAAMCEMYEKGVQSIGGLQEEWRWILDNCDYDSGGGHWYFNGTPYFTDEIIEECKANSSGEGVNISCFSL